ncbi:CD82 antigen-like [Halichondria panicea]|uniref:CD82 antigen-like n=1 Tax=Halichondria panicea TaxID=6063 RepID=UPI00312B79A5
MASKQVCFSCCTHFWRILFMIVNTVFALIGLGLTGLGIYLLASGNDLQFITGNQYANGGALILIAGLITFIIALVGLIGAAGMWSCVIAFYIVFMTLVVILEIVAGVLGFVYQMELGEIVAVRVTSAFDTFNAEDNDVTALVNFMQGEFQCCGYDSYEDWLDTPYLNNTQLFPDSCNCTNASTVDCISVPEVPNQMIYDRNCSAGVRSFLEENLIVIGAVGITFGVLELFGLGISIALCACFCYIKKHEDDYNFNKAV